MFDLIEDAVKRVPGLYKFASVFLDVLFVYNLVFQSRHVDNPKDCCLPHLKVTNIKNTKRFIESHLNFLYFFFKEVNLQFVHLLSTYYSGL